MKPGDWRNLSAELWSNLDDFGNEPMETNPSSTVTAEEGWRELVQQGLRLKTNLLRSEDFKSTAEVSKLTRVGEAAIRRQIGQRELFALTSPTDGEHKIPVWAIDQAMFGAVTKSILLEAGSADSWHVYHFLTTPQGSLNGLRPFELLLSEQNISTEQRVARDELIGYLKLSGTQGLLSVVLQALKADLNENG